jgi:hypothetical protein
LPDARLLVYSGSLPPGMDPGVIADLVGRARSRRVRAIIDAEGEALAAAVSAKADLVKPNVLEAAEFLGRSLGGVPEAAEAAREIVGRGVGACVITLRGEGAVAAAGRRAWHVRGPREEVVRAIGAGDSFAAGLAVALLRAKSSRMPCGWPPRPERPPRAGPGRAWGRWRRSAACGNRPNFGSFRRSYLTDLTLVCPVMLMSMSISIFPWGPAAEVLPFISALAFMRPSGSLPVDADVEIQLHFQGDRGLELHRAHLAQGHDQDSPRSCRSPLPERDSTALSVELAAGLLQVDALAHFAVEHALREGLDVRVPRFPDLDGLLGREHVGTAGLATLLVGPHERLLEGGQVRSGDRAAVLERELARLALGVLDRHRLALEGERGGLALLHLGGLRELPGLDAATVRLRRKHLFRGGVAGTPRPCSWARAARVIFIVIFMTLVSASSDLWPLTGLDSSLRS